MPQLVLGPLLRYVDSARATVWVETDGPARVAVQVEGGEHAARTFRVDGHHYALVLVEGLSAGGEHPYTVSLDGAPVWPQPGLPPSTICTPAPDDAVSLLFGSCRVAAPSDPQHLREKGPDALREIAVRLAAGGAGRTPDALLLLGDQVYADEVSPATAAFIRSRREGGPGKPPLDEVVDFEEYSRLYQESWSEPAVRWLLSTVPSAMIFDDHDVRDDWNTSEAWREQVARLPWWRDRIVGGLASYWIYQHLGNLSPDALAEDQVWAGVQEDAAAGRDSWPRLRAFAWHADQAVSTPEYVRWSYTRDFGGTRLVVIDSRCGRMLRPEDARQMIDDAELDWLRDQCAGECEHLLFATSLPFLLPRGIHDLEAWNEAVCAGAWGPRWARWGERIRQGVDLEHWAAFRRSFDAVVALIREIAVRPAAPATMVFLSGDVHNAYVAAATLPGLGRATSRVYQAVCSPFRNPVDPKIQLGNRLARTAVGRGVGWALRRAAGVRDPAIRWRVQHGPYFDNEVARLDLSGRRAHVSLERAELGPDGRARLVPVFGAELAR